MREFRCKYCNKLFFKGDVIIAKIEIKCRNCKNFNVITEGEFAPFLFQKDEDE
jgi:phage FluMu protein Com